ncbi:threonine/serine exporter family protein [Blautia sp. HCP28S3_G10]|uniref:threonine/serine exporter family protein n=1 Tax=Blautia sp. HCP28S3_G10 TaxID=3438908 RepID=UPI003F8906CD
MQITEYDENKLLHLLLEMGERLLDAGAEINRVEDTLERIGLAYGASKMNVFVITSSIIITMETSDGRLLTHTRRVNFNNSTDFTVLEQLNELSRQCCTNPLPPEEFAERMRVCEDPARRRTLYVGSIIASGSFAMFFGGTWQDAFVAAVVSILICFLQEKGTKLFSNSIMFDLVCAFLSGTVICIIVKILPFLNMDKIMIGDIMLLIPGIAITNAIRDMLMGDTISGLMRLIEGILWAGALAAGFMAAIWMVEI